MRRRDEDNFPTESKGSSQKKKLWNLLSTGCSTQYVESEKFDEFLFKKNNKVQLSQISSFANKISWHFYYWTIFHSYVLPKLIGFDKPQTLPREKTTYENETSHFGSLVISATRVFQCILLSLVDMYVCMIRCWWAELSSHQVEYFENKTHEYG